MQLALPLAGGSGAPGGAGGGRVPARVPGDLAWRDAGATDRNAVAQPCQHGRRGNHTRQSAGRRRPAVRLRQDHAVAAYGCRERQHPDDRRLGRSHAQRKIPRHRHWVRHEHLVDVGRRACRKDDHRRVPRGRVLHAPLSRALHGDGHCLDDGEHGRVARRCIAGQRGIPCGRRATQCSRPRIGAPHRADGAREPHTGQDPDTPGLRERDPHERCDRRFDQRGDPPDCHCASHRCEAVDRRLG